jgi:hypothetical protein
MDKDIQECSNKRAKDESMKAREVLSMLQTAGMPISESTSNRVLENSIGIVNVILGRQNQPYRMREIIKKFGLINHELQKPPKV